MVNASIVFQQTTCILPQAILLYRGRERVLPPRYFNLGRFGAAISAIAVVWVVYLDIIYRFPTAPPVTADNMSYVSVVCVGLFSFVIAVWFTTKRGNSKDPLIDHDLLHARRMDAIDGIDGAERVEETHTSKADIIEKISAE